MSSKTSKFCSSCYMLDNCLRQPSQNGRWFRGELIFSESSICRSRQNMLPWLGSSSRRLELGLRMRGSKFPSSLFPEFVVSYDLHRPVCWLPIRFSCSLTFSRFTSLTKSCRRISYVGSTAAVDLIILNPGAPTANNLLLSCILATWINVDRRNLI